MITNPRPIESQSQRAFRTDAARPLSMLAQCPVYQPSPLDRMPELAAHLGLGAVWIKDETQRMRLGSFKALGGVFAVAQMIRDAAGVDDFAAATARACAAQMTFITASAGNHGLSVAAGARIFGAHSVVVLDGAVPEGFAARIRALGAKVRRVAGSYEDAVAYASAAAAANDWILLADGSWPGYVDRPALVMEGYSVLAEECRRTFSDRDTWPSHVFIQAGVGGLAASLAGHIRDNWAVQPVIVVVEPDSAACLMQSVRAGRLTRAEGVASAMGRLDCKDASLIAFDALWQDADAFTTVTDDQAKDAVALYARHGIDTTPSGAAPLAALAAADLDSDSRCLIIATEGPAGGRPATADRSDEQ
nr:diaminopropionate ammonia-lyase [Maritimibacter sp. HL-12]